jgi:hypothetical protein
VLHLLSRWGGGGKLGCYNKREETAAVDTNTNGEVEMSITGDVDAIWQRWDKHCQNIGTTLATRACRAAANSSKYKNLNEYLSGVTQRDVMNWINNDSDTFGEF